MKIELKKTLYIIGAIICLIMGVLNICLGDFSSILTGIILIIFAIGIPVLNFVKFPIRCSNTPRPLAPGEIYYPDLIGTPKEIITLHWDTYQKFNGSKSIMTCIKSDEESAWQLLSDSNAYKLVLHLHFYKDAEKLQRFRNHMYYSLFEGDCGELETEALDLELNTLNAYAIVVFSAIVKDIFLQRGSNVRAYLCEW